MESLENMEGKISEVVTNLRPVNVEVDKEMEFYGDLCLAQSEIAEVSFLKTKRGYNYNYTPLSEILPIVLKVLTKHNLGIVQYYGVLEGNIILKTILFHRNGFKKLFPSIMPIIGEGNTGKVNVAQIYGATLTYLRRYSISTLFGITTEEDTDAEVRTTNANTNANANAKTSVKSIADAIKAIEGLGLKYNQIENLLLITSDYNTCIGKKNQLKGLGFNWDTTNKAWSLKVS